MEDYILVKLESYMVGLMVKINSDKYTKHIHYEANKKVLYLRFLKVLYGCIKSGLF